MSVAPPACPAGSVPAASPPRARGAGGGWEPPRVPARPVPRSPAFLPEEAVNEVKRQAMSELQKAVSDAERKAHELITTERAKMERALAEAKRQASEDALTVINQQEDSSEVGLAGTRLGGGTGWVLGTCSAAAGWLRHRWWGWDGECGLGRGVRGLG